MQEIRVCKSLGYIRDINQQLKMDPKHTFFHVYSGAVTLTFVSLFSQDYELLVGTNPTHLTASCLVQRIFNILDFFTLYTSPVLVVFFSHFKIPISILCFLFNCSVSTQMKVSWIQWWNHFFQEPESGYIHSFFKLSAFDRFQLT